MSRKAVDVDIIASIRRIPPNAPIQAKAQISYLIGTLRSQLNGGMVGGHREPQLQGACTL